MTETGMGQSRHSVTLAKLGEAKKEVSLFAMDYDGTLSDGGKFGIEQAVGLIRQILSAGKIPAIITARAATAVKIFMPPLDEHYREHKSPVPTYIAGGNGTVLYRLDSTAVRQIYSHGLSLQEIKKIVGEWQDYAEQNLKVEDLSEKGRTTFQKFYKDNWDHLIPEEVLNVGRPYNNRIFTEEAKVTFVLPKDVSSHGKVVADMQQLVGNNFSVVAGDKDFCHITKRLAEDSKVVAVKTILQELGLSENQVATFGDMPEGNDVGLLSFPYSFTNSSAIASKKKLAEPPYTLPGEGLSVARVYNAIRYLLNT